MRKIRIPDAAHLLKCNPAQLYQATRRKTLTRYPNLRPGDREVWIDFDEAKAYVTRSTYYWHGTAQHPEQRRPAS